MISYETKIDNSIAPLFETYVATSDMDFTSISEKSDIINRNLYIGAIEEGTGAALEVMIRYYNKIDEENDTPVEDRVPIKVYINSVGGYLTEALTAVDAITLSKTPVYTINQCCAYSGGFIIYLAGHKRFTFKNSSFLFHEGSITVGGDAHKFQNQADFYKRQRLQVKDFVINQTDISAELYDEHSKDDWWMDSKDSVELGISHKILTQEDYIAL